MSSLFPSLAGSVHQAVPAWTDHIALDPAYRCAALTRCCEAWSHAQQTERANGTSGVACYLRANEAYRSAMPPLTTENHIRDFIACVAHGMMMRVFLPNVAAKLLYAAQVASRALNRQPKSKKKLSKKKREKHETPLPERF